MRPSTTIGAACRQPLLHFLLLGGLLFAAYSLLEASPAASRDDIHVGREQLLRSIQFRARSFDRAGAERELNAMDREQRQALEQAWLREEVLYREALAMGLHGDDDVIRQRLVQKLAFRVRGFIESGIALDREQVARYFAAQRERYAQPARITFTHVFYSKALHGAAQAAHLARAGLATLQAGPVSFAAATAYGDPFSYHRNYVERSREYIAAQFDAAFAAALFEPGAQDGRWHGPLESPLGFHLVLITQRHPARPAQLDEIYPQVQADAREARVQQAMDGVIEELIARYRVSTDAGRSS